MGWRGALLWLLCLTVQSGALVGAQASRDSAGADAGAVETGLAAAAVDAGMQRAAAPREELPLRDARLVELLRDIPTARLEELGKVSDRAGNLQRTFMSPAAMRASRLIDSWMQQAGMRTWMDDMANVHGRLDGPNATAPALLLGSHLDTVLDAGKYDGALGIVVAIAAVHALVSEGLVARLRQPIEVIAFSDEEGVRFQSTFLGSTALTGRFAPELLQATDKSGVTLASALSAVGMFPSAETLRALKRRPSDVDSYVEVHIEQGPVLEAEGVPLGVVPAIAGQTRLLVTVVGEQGHAGTVPMNLRRDAMAAAAEAVVVVEHLCRHTQDLFAVAAGSDDSPTGAEADVSGLVCTIGELNAWPGASNVIPGKVVLTIDVRARRGRVRTAALALMDSRITELCQRRGVQCTIARKHDAEAVECGSRVVASLAAAASRSMRALGMAVADDAGAVKVPMVVSGAGHDAMAMAQLTQVGMLFVRCCGGVSHSPAEHVDPDDIWAAGAAILVFLHTQAVL